MIDHTDLPSSTALSVYAVAPTNIELGTGATWVQDALKADILFCTSPSMSTLRPNTSQLIVVELNSAEVRPQVSVDSNQHEVLFVRRTHDQKLNLQLLEDTWSTAKQLLHLRSSLITNQKRARALELASESLSQTHDEDRIFTHLVEIVAKELQSNRVSLLHVDHEQGILQMRAAKGIPPEVVQLAKPKIGEGISGLCAARGEPIFIADHQQFKQTQGAVSSADLGLRHDLPMSLTVPIKVRGEVVGVVNVTDRANEDPYTSQEITFLSSLMSHAGYLMESANLIKGLKALQAFSDCVINTLSDPLAVIDSAGALVQGNSSFLQRFPHISTGEIVVNELKESDTQTALLSALEIGDTWQKNDWKYDGHTYDLHLTPFEAEGGSALLYFQDVTERQMMGRQLVSAEKMASLGILAAGVAHEINNPLGFVKTNTKEAKRYFEDLFEVIESWRSWADHVDQMRKNGQPITHGSEGPREVEEEVEIDEIKQDYQQLITESLDGLDRIQKITTSLKSFAHPDSENAKEASLAKLIEHSLVITQGKWKHHLLIDNTVSGDIPPISCIPNQLEQVFMNLVVNAAQAANGHGKQANMAISATLVNHNTEVHLQFRDECGGIPQNVVERIFDPFFTTKDIGEGTGLGLHIAHNIIEGHGGSIQVDSEPPRGTTFHITLPLNRSEKPMVIKQLSRFKI